MNIFFVLRGELVTPPLSGSILPGVTRDTVLTLAREWKIPVAERCSRSIFPMSHMPMFPANDPTGNPA